MRRTTIGVGGVGAVLVAVSVLAGPAARPAAGVSVSQDAGTPSATARSVSVVPVATEEAAADPTATRAAEEAELADLRTRVAGLATEVARLGGTGTEALRGRIGGARAGFDEAYGSPVAEGSDGEATYEVPDVGRLTARFEDGRAVELVVTPAERPEDAPVSEPDPADWGLERAREISLRFAPADAELPESEPARPAEGRRAVGESAALAAEASTPVAAECPVAPAGTFAAAYTTPTRDTVSVVTLTLAAGGVAEPDPPGTRLSAQGGGTRARSSLPSGVTRVNGVAVEGIQARVDADGSEESGEGRLVSVELELENGTERELEYEPEHFVLTDEEGRELTAVCGGEEPAIVAGTLAPGESVEGWVNFLVPEGFEAEEVTYLVDGSNRTLIIFTLR